MLILLIILPFIGLSQKIRKTVNEVTTVDGTIYSGKIESYLGKKIYFIYVTPELEDKSLSIENVVRITGATPNSRKKAILKSNPAVQFDTPIEKFSDPIYENDLSNQPFGQGVISNITPGDYLERAGNRYLYGLGLEICGGIIISASSTSESPKEGMIIGGLVGLTGAIVAITGHFQLIKAGKAFNREAVTISAASEGIGLAINF